MSKDKKPDQVVFNEDTQKYDAALKPYATNVGAPQAPSEVAVKHTTSGTDAHTRTQQ